ncbi:MAG: isoleucine--tRNA ligase [Candidatus Levybacteria bacterium]|nr:isoleucine--tRNA ligase [Candidatus Levybacteria bacterium]
MFKSISSQVNFPLIEEEILSFWKENKIFEKSLKKRAPRGDWTFLDGPPFVTGMPHYGSLLSSLPKDVFGRYYTMKGYHVRRVWGWDGHGLPIENKVEGELQITRKKDIEEKIGVKKFIERCLHYVNQVSDEWEWYVDHIGRWVDFKNAYKTWDLPYMESVMWVFKQMYDKDYIYKGLRVSLYCPHCATPISNFEVAMDADNYKVLKDPATVYKYPLLGEKKTFVLAWSTTPWNKIVTPALAVSPNLAYVKVTQNTEQYILAKSTIKLLGNPKDYQIIEEIKGSELVGKKFVPHYDYYKERIKEGEKAFEIIGGDFVTAEEGTGVVTIAAYGEEDLKAMNEENIHIEMHLDEEGNVKEDVPLFGGMYYLKANKAVEEDLEKRGLIYKAEELEHNVPLCWRCHTRLYYAPIDAWYVNIQILKDKMAKTNKEVNWFPRHFKNGRFLKSLENAPDWNISRNRYWGSPVPVWECTCGERFVPGSIEELEKRAAKKITNLHKPDIDDVVVKCEKCGKDVRRVSEVLDSWIEAGSASFGERHYPFNGNEKLESFYPPDFIAEYTGQIRAWFYVLHVIANALDLREDGKNYLSENVLVEGVILGTDGRKMSKNYHNYPDPKELIGKYGGDALRLYLLGSPVMHGEDIIISEEQYRQQVKGMLLILWNTYNFFVSYANVDRWDSSKKLKNSKNVLDKWILSLLNRLILEVTEDLDEFDTASAITKIGKFIDEFSTWYIRRSRDRVGPATEDGEDKKGFYTTSFEVFTALSKIIAPLAPFTVEEIYKNLTDEESVHLADWPEADKTLINESIEKEMIYARQIVEQAHAVRKDKGYRVRQPLNSLVSISPVQFSPDIVSVISQETNILKVENMLDENATASEVKSIDFTQTQRLIDQGNARDIIRKIQEERKKIGTSLSEKVNVSLPSWPIEFEEEIKKKALVETLSKGEFFVSRT